MKKCQIILPCVFAILYNWGTQAAVLSNLSSELHALILANTEIADILSFCASSKKNQELCDAKKNDAFWDFLVQRDFGKNYLGEYSPTGMSWKDIYILNYESAKPSTIALGLDHTCAIRQDKSLRCWGVDHFPQAAQLKVPDDLGPVTAVSAGSSHTCAIKTDGNVDCFGNYGWVKAFIPSDLGPVKAISSGENHICAIKADDTLECWGGYNEKYSIEYKGYGQAIVPDDLGKVKAVSAALEHTCAIKTDGTLVCFGTEYMPKVPESIGKVIAVETNHLRTCVIKNDKSLACFAPYEFSQIDVPSDLGKVKKVATGIDQVCAIKADDTLRCFGKGEGTNVPADLGKVKAVEAESGKTCALTVNGTLRCFGKAYRGELKIPDDLGPVLMR